jgi:predicted enzyme related to lactoylglutathione lyase
MLKDCPTRCTLPAQDMIRARAFYEQKLGLLAVEEFPDGGVNYDAGGTRITVFPSQVRPLGHHTQLGFDVQDIRAVIQDLEDKGVRFEDYEYFNFKTDGHLVNIAPYNCGWFRDSEGNSLAIWEADSAPPGNGMMMLRDCTAGTNLPAHDMKGARRFYEQMLGLEALEEFADGGVAYEAGATQFTVSPTTVTPSREHTQIAFDVQDVQAEMLSLEHAGVVFDDYVRPESKRTRDVGSTGGLKVARFKDSEGNRLSLVEGVRTAAGSSKARQAS